MASSFGCREWGREVRRDDQLHVFVEKPDSASNPLHALEQFVAPRKRGLDPAGHTSVGAGCQALVGTGSSYIEITVRRRTTPPAHAADSRANIRACGKLPARRLPRLGAQTETCPHQRLPHAHRRRRITVRHRRRRAS